MKLTGLDFVHAVDRLAADFGIAPIPENGVKPFVDVSYERSAQFHRSNPEVGGEPVNSVDGVFSPWNGQSANPERLVFSP